MKTLHLNVKKKWFDMIASGKKKEEYREIKPYWCNRLLWHEFHEETGCLVSLEDALYYDSEQIYSTGVFRTDFDTVTFKNGYQKVARTMVVELKHITYGNAKPEWSDNWQGKVFIIKLGDIINI